ncbi:uncharacterized protein [Scyliorhinus torazame]|uniref:uncharacterized protein isoform X1 n=1 Tax=Scyliorhinus torazame TaxID=75743 RepID=UPI003B5A1E3F
MLCLVALCLFFFSFVHFATCSDSPRRTVPKEGVLVDAFHNRSIITNHHHLEEELKHHLGELDLNEISEQELEFYYFTLHDFDKNMLLDGLEIMTALEDSLEETLAPFSTDDTMKLLIGIIHELRLMIGCAANHSNPGLKEFRMRWMKANYTRMLESETKKENAGKSQQVWQHRNDR